MNYPPGVTGNEYEIAGPDYEEEIDGRCPNGHRSLVQMGYRHRHWIVCDECDYYLEGDD